MNVLIPSLRARLGLYKYSGIRPPAADPLWLDDAADPVWLDDADDVSGAAVGFLA